MTSFQDTNSQLQMIFARKPEVCPYCGASHIIRFGKYKTTHRYRCMSCRKTFISITGTAIYYIHKKQKFLQFVSSVNEYGLKSIIKTSKEFNISTLTAFDWRHKFLLSMPAENNLLTKELGVNNHENKYSQKGRRGTKAFFKSNFQNKKLPDSNLIFFATEYVSKTKLTNIGKLRPQYVSRAFKDLIYQKFNLITTLDKELLNQVAKKRSFDVLNVVPDRAYEYLSLKTLDNFSINFFDNIKKKMRGVATKYLSVYANYFRVYFNRKKYSLSEYMKKLSTWPEYTQMENFYKAFMNNYSEVKYNNPTNRKWKLCYRFILCNFEYVY